MLISQSLTAATGLLLWAQWVKDVDQLLQQWRAAGERG